MINIKKFVGLRWLLFLLLPVCGTAGTDKPGDSTQQSIDKAHHEIWKRFVNKQFNILYDFTNPAGEVFIPEKKEVEQLYPNGLSYNTVIEDGAFYNGLYLDGLCERWKRLRTPEAASEAKAIAQGLIRLATVSKAPGFIARNILPDGVTYYPAGSDDQTFPWFYGMWKYLRSGIPDAKQQAVIKSLLVEKADALQRYNWDIPCDPIEFGFYGSFSKAGNKHLVRIPFITRILYSLTGETHWKVSYRKSLNEIPAGESLSRQELLANGIPYGKPGDNKYNFWLSGSSQAALRELYLLEDDPLVKVAYKTAMKNSAVRTLEHIQLYRNFDNGNTLFFQVNWRYLNAFWRPQRDCWEARKLGLEQVEYNYIISPKDRHEFQYMTEPLFAAWVLVLSEEPELIKAQLPMIRDLLNHYQWDHIIRATIFISESVYFEALKYGL